MILKYSMCIGAPQSPDAKVRRICKLSAAAGTLHSAPLMKQSASSLWTFTPACWLTLLKLPHDISQGIK